MTLYIMVPNGFTEERLIRSIENVAGLATGTIKDSGIDGRTTSFREVRIDMRHLPKRQANKVLDAVREVHRLYRQAAIPWR